MCQCAWSLKQNPFILHVCSLLSKTGCEWPLTAQTLSLHSPVNSKGPQRRWRAWLWSVYGGVCAFFCWLFLRSAPGLESGRAETDLPWRRTGSVQECQGIGTWLNLTHAHVFTLCWDSTRIVPMKTRPSCVCSQTVFHSHNTASVKSTVLIYNMSYCLLSFTENKSFLRKKLRNVKLNLKDTYNFI